jgi:copper chaperone CopZ
MLKGFSPGAALVLLMAGPATNAATITMIGKVLGKKSLISFIGTVIVGALLSGLFIDYVLPHKWFIISEHFGHMGHSHEMLPTWLKIASAILLTLLIINGYIQKFLTTMKIKSQSATQPGFSIKNIQTIHVSGMTYNHCKANVENSVKSSEGVEEATVDLSSGTVIIKGSSFDLEKIKSGIESIGYKIMKE